MLARLWGQLLGGPKNLLDPRIFQNLSLIAFFAWVGLGSDGLSSSAYGPEEAYLQLGAHRELALYLVIATIATVFIIASSYSQIVEMFPTGGGGYLVATKLLGPAPGVIAGCALVVDYVLTISISVASGCAAIFSFLPGGWHDYRLPAAVIIIAGLTALNIRGVRESIAVLVPIFLAFMASHLALIGYGIFSHGRDLGPLVAKAVADTHGGISELGLVGMLVIFVRAYSLGGGTYTGIEAVSNSTDILREPRVVTGKRTMLYMAISLAFTAGGILLCYMLSNVNPVPGRTLNAVLWEQLTSSWRIGGWDVSPAIAGFTLLSEGALLFVAAQTGFIAGPRTLAAMGSDQWVPKRMAHLSERLVTQNGVVTMGVAAALLVLQTRGAVSTLVVMYATTVFIAFTLTQAGMVRHWWRTRHEQAHWRRRLATAAVGTLVTGGMLVLTVLLKFAEGVWLSLLATGALAVVSFLIHSHYHRTQRMQRSLDEVLGNVPLAEHGAPAELTNAGPTAILLVESYGGLGIHTLLSILRMFPRNHYRNFVFCSVGLVDSGQFKGTSDVEALEAKVRGDLEKYVALAQRMGVYAEYRYTLGTDLISELETMSLDVTREFRRCVVFAGQLVFEKENLFTRSLHHETAFSVQRRLQFRGVQVVILPIRVWDHVQDRLSTDAPPAGRTS